MKPRVIPGFILFALFAIMLTIPGCDRLEPRDSVESCKEAGDHYVKLFNDDKDVQRHYPNPKMAAWTMRRNIIQRCTRGQLNPRCILANHNFIEAHRCVQ